MNENPANKLTSTEKNEIDKYTRFLVFKISQVIVQSRFGEKKKGKNFTKSALHDWFNLAIEDNPEIQGKVKEAFNAALTMEKFCVCTEILLKTVDGDTLVLEMWSLKVNNYNNETHVPRPSFASVYSRMTLLLKSVICVTRVTPAYKLSLCQSADTYVILFRVYAEEPQVHLLGEHFQENKIGEVYTPLGCIRMSVAYRSKDDMTITPQKVEKESPFMVKSDYFKPDMSPKRLCPSGIRMDRNPLEDANPLPKGFFNHYTSPVSHAQSEKHPFPMNSTPDTERGIRNGGFMNGERKKSCLNCQTSPNDFRKIGAFAVSSTLPDTASFPELELLEKPFLNLSRSKLNYSDKKSEDLSDSNRNSDRNANLNHMDNKKEAHEVDYNCNANESGCQKMTSSDSSDCEDFVMVELKPPFAGCDSDNDLGAFFRECQCAPPLASFASQPTLEEQVNDITTQLAKFETSMNDFDNFVDSICQIDGEK